MKLLFIFLVSCILVAQDDTFDKQPTLEEKFKLLTEQRDLAILELQRIQANDRFVADVKVISAKYACSQLTSDFTCVKNENKLEKEK